MNIPLTFGLPPMLFIRYCSLLTYKDEHMLTVQDYAGYAECRWR